MAAQLLERVMPVVVSAMAANMPTAGASSVRRFDPYPQSPHCARPLPHQHRSHTVAAGLTPSSSGPPQTPTQSRIRSPSPGSPFALPRSASGSPFATRLLDMVNTPPPTTSAPQNTDASTAALRYSPVPEPGTELHVMLQDFAVSGPFALDFLSYEMVLDDYGYTPDIIPDIESIELQNLLEAKPGEVRRLKKFAAQWTQRLAHKLTIGIV